MKKVALGILTALAAIFALGGCDSSAKNNTSSEGMNSESSIESVVESVVESSSEEESDSKEPALEEETPTYLYNDFTPTEVALFETYVGDTIPFIPNDEYYVEGYYEETDYENGMCFYTIGNTQQEFDEYRAAYLTAGYTLTDTYQDDEDDTWYSYEKGDLFVEMCYYDYDGEYWLEVYVVSTSEEGGADNTQDPPVEDDEDKPTETEGTRVVDFTKATNVKNVTDQGSYLGGCPTTGKVKVLVIPVEFMDCTAKSKGYEISKINTIFNGASGTTDYFSVKEYYSIASYGKLDLEFEVVNSWFKPKNVSSYYKNATMTDEYGEFDVGDMLVMNEALAYLESRMDLSKFDSDKNGMIDAVVMINTVEIDSDYTFNWAFRYWNYYTDNYGNYYEYDGVTANDYIWASYKFIMESREKGKTSYSHDTMNPYTYIHEFGHVLGADDYYDFSGTSSYGPMEGYDIMDAMTGDHNAFTKFNYGWVTSARLITAEDSVTLTLDSFTETGDAVLIASNWDDKLGAYQEYYLVVYYTNTGLNTGEGGYFDEEGILVFHVNASLIGQDYYGDGEIYYDLKYNNAHPDSEYGTEEYLIEIVDQGGGNYVYTAGKSLAAKTQMDNGSKIPYVFTVNAINEEGATVTFRKNA